jgi:hypothetical protein
MDSLPLSASGPYESAANRRAILASARRSVFAALIAMRSLMYCYTGLTSVPGRSPG